MPPTALEAAIGVLEPDVLRALQKAIDNVRAVVNAQLAVPVAVELPEGQRVEVVEAPVRRAGLYIPAGRRPTRPRW